MPGLMLTCDSQLFFGHVDTGHMAIGPDKACQRIDVAPGAAAEIEHSQAAKLRRNGQAAAVVPLGNSVMHAAQCSTHMQGRRRLGRAGIGPQV